MTVQVIYAIFKILFLILISFLTRYFYNKTWIKKRYIIYSIPEEDKDEKIYNRMKEHWMELEKRGYDTAALFLQGSQNYGLDEYSDEYMSDVDTKAIVIPSLEDFIKNKEPVSTTIILDNNEHIDVKDIRLMFKNFEKMNISYIELLYTKYRMINPRYKDEMMELIGARDRVAAFNKQQFIKCIYGMAMEKRKALCHPYPSIVDKIEKYGYDGKQLSHCARLVYFLRDYLDGKPIAECFVPNEIQRQSLMSYKKYSDNLTVAEAVSLCDSYIAAITELKEKGLEKFPAGTTDANKLLAALNYKVMLKKIKGEIK